ncbi:MAG: ribosome recycling factor [Deltaproteobacteria bacterium]|nr:ribosome recycling factor [Deltaproteobacteria bacterium]
MDRAIEFLRSELAKLRVGRAHTSMVDHIKVQVYGSTMTVKEVAALSIPDARTISIQPWDRSVISEIEKGILAANLGITPINDGKVIRINLPALTEDRRKDFVKQIKKLGEDAKVAVRNTRREAMDSLKSAKDSSEISEDEWRRIQEEVQKTTDQFVSEIEKVVDGKSKEVMTL